MDEPVDRLDGSAPADDLNDGTVDSAVEAELARLQQTEPENGPDEGEPEPDETESEDAPEEEADTDDEPEALADFEFGGKKFQVPAEVAEALREGTMLKADHTRKTMEVAEGRKYVEQRYQQVEQLFQHGQAYVQENAVLQNVEQQIKSINDQTNWQALQSDPVEFSQRTAILTHLNNQRNALLQAVETRRQAYMQTEMQRVAGLLQESEKHLAQALPDFGKVKDKLIAYAQKNSGLNPQTLAYINSGEDPQALVLLEKARRWDELQAAKPAQMKRVASAQPVIKPGSATQGKSSNVEVLGKKLRSSGGIDDAIALELARMQSGRRR